MAWLNSSRRICRLGLLLLSWPEVGPPPPSGPPFLEPPLLLRLNKLVISGSSAALPLPLTGLFHSSGFSLQLRVSYQFTNQTWLFYLKKHNLLVE
jgi:hypothetical protein